MAEILWDRFGVPHIYAEDDPALFRGFGRAQAAAYGETIVRLYIRARGEAAAHWGEDWLRSDWWTLTLGIPERARNWLGQQPDDFLILLDAFAAGFNGYLADNPTRFGEDIVHHLPICAADILAHAHRVLTMEFLVNPLVDPAAAGRPAGSNAWAIAPKLNIASNAMLLAAPHVPWTETFRWFEAHLLRPGLSLYGATLIGFPVLVMGFNQRLGWALTANAHSGAMLYDVETTDGGYRLDNETLSFASRQESALIRHDDRMERLRWEVRLSRHGVVLPLTDRCLALRIAGLDRPRALHQWWKMACATDLSRFEAALVDMQIPAFSVVYADADGHILYFFGGLVPVWRNGYAPPRDRPIPGGRTETLWDGLHGYHDLPRVSDPVSGWVHNANDPPWSATFPGAPDPECFPAYMAPRGPISLRAQWSFQRLRNARPMSFEDMIAAGLSLHMELADRVLEPLLAAARRRPGEIAQMAVKILESWDRTAHASSRGAALFAAWLSKMPSNFFAEPWRETAPFDTPCGLADPHNAALALEQAFLDLEARFGRADLPWGTLSVMKPAIEELGACGADIPFGVFRELWFEKDADGTSTARGGTGFLLAVEFADPPRASALNLHGNFENSWESGRFAAQTGLYFEGKLRSVALNREDVEAACVMRDRF